MSFLIQSLRTKGFHVNEFETKATIFWHGDFVLSLTRYNKNSEWKHNQCSTSEKSILWLCDLKAHNWNVKRIYLRNRR